MLTLKPAVQEKWSMIEVDGGSFEVLLKRPTYRQMTESLTAENRAAYRIESIVAGWRGVNDESGKPVDFSHTNLQRLCEVQPKAFLALISAVNDQFFGFTGDDEKN